MLAASPPNKEPQNPLNGPQSGLDARDKRQIFHRREKESNYLFAEPLA